MSSDTEGEQRGAIVVRADGSGPARDHQCRPPGALLPWHDPPQWTTATSAWHGSLWRCDCGRYWHGAGKAWLLVSARRARRIARRRGVDL